MELPVVNMLTLMLMSSIALVSSSSSGAPSEACVDMVPGHGDPGNDPPPFTITPSSETYTPGQTIELLLEWNGNAEGFKGFLIKVTRPGSLQAVGSLQSVDVLLGTMACKEEEGNGLTHTSADLKTSVEILWTAPLLPAGDLEVRVTIVEERATYWAAQHLADLIDGTADEPSTGTIPMKTSAEPFTGTIHTEPSPTGEPTTHKADPADPTGSVPIPEFIDLTTCGLEKSCFRNPENCEGIICDYILTWVANGDHVDYEMSASLENQKYVAMGLSSDRSMGSDSVTQCIFDESASVVKIANSFNEDKSNEDFDDPFYGLEPSSLRGGYTDGMVTCFFSKRIVNDGSGSELDQERAFDLTELYHILMVKGDGQDGTMIPHNPSQTISSQEMIDMTSSTYVTIGGSIPDYPLVKAHACLMILAWMICASIGVLMPRHAKQLWADHDVNKLKLWFQIHRSLMVFVFLTTIVAFVIIFVEVDGLSEPTESPDKAHPIMGIVVTALAVANPIIAIFRCGPDDGKRPIFNWVHFLVGTSAHVGAVANIFIGTYMTKAKAPNSTRYILVIFAVIHIITELCLFMCAKCCKKDTPVVHNGRISIEDDDKLPPRQHDNSATIRTAVLIAYTIVTVALGAALITILGTA